MVWLSLIFYAPHSLQKSAEVKNSEGRCSKAFRYMILSDSRRVSSKRGEAIYVDTIHASHRSGAHPVRGLDGFIQSYKARPSPKAY